MNLLEGVNASGAPTFGQDIVQDMLEDRIDSVEESEIIGGMEKGEKEKTIDPTSDHEHTPPDVNSPAKLIRKIKRDSDKQQGNLSSTDESNDESENGGYVHQPVIRPGSKEAVFHLQVLSESEPLS